MNNCIKIKWITIYNEISLNILLRYIMYVGTKKYSDLIVLNELVQIKELIYIDIRKFSRNIIFIFRNTINIYVT